VLREAEPIAEGLDDALRLGWIASFLSTHYLVSGDSDPAIVAGERALALATTCEQVALQADARLHLGQAYHVRGHYQKAVEVLTWTLVYGCALRILHDPTAAEEVTIEVYMQVYQQAARYDCRRGTPSAWLMILTRSRAIDRRRQDAIRRQREASPDVVVVPSFPPEPEVYSTALEQHRVVQTAPTTLKPRQRQVIKMAYFEGLSHSEIAATLGQPLGTVKTQMRIGLRYLRDVLHQLHTVS
jgi:RNA polymerase sigma-70 factor, ECF subfamily